MAAFLGGSASAWFIAYRALARERLKRLQAETLLNANETAERKLTDTFKALSADALRDNNQAFLDLAKTSFATIKAESQGELDKRQQAIEGLVAPVTATLRQVDEKLQAMEVARAGA